MDNFGNNMNQQNGQPMQGNIPNMNKQMNGMNNQQGGQAQGNSNQNTTLNKQARNNGSQIQWVGNMAPGAIVGTRKNIKIIDSYEFPQYGMRVEILEYQKLIGSTNIYGAQSLWFMNEANIKCRQIAIYMMNSSCKIEAGAMSYYQGPLEMTTGINGAGKFVSQMFTGKLTGEKMIMPEYRGSGILVLEPSFKHFFVGELEPGEEIIVDKGMFYAASTSVNVAPVFAGSATGTLLGGEGIFMQKLSGPGMIVLELPVPMDEINICKLNNDVLRVDGNFAVLRDASIAMTVEGAGKTLVGSAMSGEGLANVFRGSGQVWLAPTIKVYDALRLAKMMGGDVAAVDMNTSTGQSKAK